MIFGKKKEEFDMDILDKPTDLPSFPEIEEPTQPARETPEMPIVKPKPKPVEKTIEVTGLQTDKPHMFIKIEKYNDVLQNIDELRKMLKNLEESNSSLAKINTQEKERVDEFKSTTKRVKELIDFFASTFVEMK